MVATQLMPEGPPAPPAVVWQAMARPVEGSWNQAVLVVPLAETPTAWKLGFARICDCAAGISASVSPAPATRAAAA
ncbi:hypothetical protein ASF43_01060 [Pseudorhodoferax sp. Leaf267]|nr:hypothetical protein ASF43_01060 [Pseudorhodoferax sp. Leaf267]